VLAEEPSAEAHTFLVWVYSFERRFAEAIAECKRAIAVDPEFGNPYNDIGVYLGRIHEQQNDPLAVARDYGRALDHLPGYEPAVTRLRRMQQRVT